MAGLLSSSRKKKWDREGKLTVLLDPLPAMRANPAESSLSSLVHDYIFHKIQNQQIAR